MPSVKVILTTQVDPEGPKVHSGCDEAGQSCCDTEAISAVMGRSLRGQMLMNAR